MEYPVWPYVCWILFESKKNLDQYMEFLPSASLTYFWMRIKQTYRLLLNTTMGALSLELVDQSNVRLSLPMDPEVPPKALNLIQPTCMSEPMIAISVQIHNNNLFKKACQII